MDFDYKKYSLEKLQDWVHDALSSGEASPHEIYSAIREAVREDYYYHKDHISRASGLLELLSGHRPVKQEKSFEETLQEEGYEWTPKQEEKSEYYYDYNRNDPNRKNPFKDKVVKWQLPVQQIIEEGVDNYFVQFPDDLLEAANLKKGDTVEWVDNSDGSYLLRKVDSLMWHPV